MYMLEAVEAMAHGTTEKINAIRDLLAETLDTAKRALPKTVFSKELTVVTLYKTSKLAKYEGGA